MRKTRYFFICWILAVMFVCVPGYAETALTLVRDGTPMATIITGKEPSRAAQFAAYELQFHVNEITGATLPIVKDDQKVAGIRILVGESEATRALGLKNNDFEPQEYLIRLMPDTLVLMGRDEEDYGIVKYGPADSKDFPMWPGTWPDLFDDQGTMYAVYDFLERFCDVRWFSPTEVGMDCPKTKTLVVKGKDIKRAPVMRLRDLGSLGTNILSLCHTYDSHIALWHKDSKGFKDYEASAYPNLHKRFLPDYMYAKRGVVRLFLHRMRFGGEKFVANHALYGYYSRFLDENSTILEKKKPDWFAKGYEGKPPHMCYTNQEFTEQVVKDAQDYFDGKGKKYGPLARGEFFAICPMDGSEYCKCPECQALENKEERDNRYYSNGHWSDYIFTYANKVAREIKKSHPDKYIVMIAYSKYARYPRFQVEPNIAVSPCLHIRNIYSAAMQENDLEILKSWTTKEKDRRIYVTLYYCFPAERANLPKLGRGLWHCFPGFFSHAIDRWFKIYHKEGVRGIQFLGFGQDVEAYISLKLCDDPTQDVDTLLDDYFRRLYGPAAEPLKKLYLAIEETYCNPDNYPEGSRGHQTKEMAWEILGTEARMAEFAKLMDQARNAMAKGTELEKRRLELFEKAVWDYMVQGRKRYLMDGELRKIPGSLGVPLLAPPPEGKATEVDWSKARVMETWRTVTNELSEQKLSVRLAHDGKYLYIRFDEMIDPKTLVRGNGNVESGDSWQIIFARRKNELFLRIVIDPSGKIATFVNGSKDIYSWDTGAKVYSDTETPEKWTVYVTLPLEKLLPGGMQSGWQCAANFLRCGPGSKIHVSWMPMLNGLYDIRDIGGIGLKSK